MVSGGLEVLKVRPAGLPGDDGTWVDEAIERGLTLRQLEEFPEYAIDRRVAAIDEVARRIPIVERTDWFPMR
jgi:hypothetical protein